MQIRPLLINAAVGALAAIAVGCATTAQPPPSRANLDNLTKAENLPGKPACFWKSSFQGDWTVLNDSTLIMHAPLPKDAYVIKLFEPVFDLSFKQGFGFEDREHTGQICNNGDDYLLVPAWQLLQVLIVAVHALDDEPSRTNYCRPLVSPCHTRTLPLSPRRPGTESTVQRRATFISGAQRITRHLWQMCVALFIAAASFFLGQAKVFPASVRGWCSRASS